MPREMTHQPGRPSRFSARIIAGTLVAPFAWFFTQGVAYALVPDACDRHDSVWLHVAHVVGILVAALGLWLAWGGWTALGRGEPDQDPGPDARSRFLSLAGVVASAVFIMLIVWQWLATFLISPCSA